MSRPLSRCAALALAVACILATGCQDKQRPKPVAQANAAAQQR